MLHALLGAPDAVRPPGAFDGLRRHMDHSPAQAVYFSALSVGDTGGELLPAGAAKFTGKDVQEVRALPVDGQCGKPLRRCGAVFHVPPDPLQLTTLAGPPEVDAHQGAPHSLRLLSGCDGCHLHFQRRLCSSAGYAASSAAFSTRTIWNHRAVPREKHVGSEYGLASRVRLSRLPLRCCNPSGLAAVPPLMPACARGAICGVARLERCDRRRA